MVEEEGGIGGVFDTLTVNLLDYTVKGSEERSLHFLCSGGKIAI